MNTSNAPASIQHVEYVMGMAVSFDIRPPLPTPSALDSAVAWLHHVDTTFSTYKLDSPISRLGRGELTLDDVTPEVVQVLRRCIQLTSLTDGAFDAFAVPAANGTNLDPSGLVKGWAIEHAANLLEQQGAANFGINAGGDIAIRGDPEPGHPWRVGIRHPQRPDQQAIVLSLAGSHAIATSATYERGAHIIDPTTGMPTTELASVTVIGPDLGDADAFATVVFVMGPAGLDWIETQPGYEAYIITHDDTTHWTSGFPATTDNSLL